MDAGLRRVLEAAFPDAEDRYFLPMSIGNPPETADEGAALILNGTKTLTSSPFWDYPDGKIPFVGALSVVLDGARRPRGIVETVRVEIMPAAMPASVGCIDGPTVGFYPPLAAPHAQKGDADAHR
jgi:uncharacterized protein YhfF